MAGIELGDDLARDLASATLQVYQRYATEVVERFGLCPWARSARESGQVVLRVVFSEDPDDFDASLSQLAELHQAADPTDIALFIYPLLGLDRLVPYVRRSPDPTLQLVRNSALSSIKGLVAGTAFLDVSALSLDALTALSEPPPKAVRERIAEQNLATVQDVGPAAIDAILTDIAQEREALHERLRSLYGQRGPQR